MQCCTILFIKNLTWGFVLKNKKALKYLKYKNDDKNQFSK